MPWVLTGVIAVISLVTAGQKIGYERLARQSVARSIAAEQFATQTPDQQERTIALGAKITRITFYLTPVIFLIVWMIIAGVLMTAFNLAFDAQVSFSCALGVVIYSSLPGCIASIWALISVLLNASPSSMNFQNMIASNPAYFMDRATSSGFLYRFCGSLDLFAFWSIFLMGIGFSIISKNRKLSRGKATVIVLILFLLWKLSTAAIGLG